MCNNYEFENQKYGVLWIFRLCGRSFKSTNSTIFLVLEEGTLRQNSGTGLKMQVDASEFIKSRGSDFLFGHLGDWAAL